MDNKYFKIIWEKYHSPIFEKFMRELEAFTKTGKYPPHASENVKYGLELQQKRLKDKKLIMKCELSPGGSSANDMAPKKRWRDDRYLSWMEFCECELSRTIYRDNKKVYNNKQKSVLYQDITDVHDVNAVGDDLYSCPNCGAVSKIAVLRSGCPFCGTFFEMDELYPKVTNYFFLRSTTGRSLKKYIYPCMPFWMIVLSVHYFISFDLNHGATFRILYSIIGGIIGGAALAAISGYLIWMVLELGTMFAEAGKSTPMLFHSAGSGMRFVSFMSRYSPEFSYQYFSDKVISLLKLIIFSENADRLPYYEGEPLGDRFLNVIESSYAGAVALKKYGVQGDYCYVTVDVYLDDLYDDGSRIKTKRDKIRMELRRNIRKPIDMNFSIEKIQCKNCGASFNAARMRNCPHCDTEYEIGDDDWIITKLC